MTSAPTDEEEEVLGVFVEALAFSPSSFGGHQMMTRCCWEGEARGAGEEDREEGPSYGVV